MDNFDLKKYLSEGRLLNEDWFSKELPADVQAEKDKGYPERLLKYSTSVGGADDSDFNNPYNEDLYKSYKSNNWEEGTTFAVEYSDYDGGNHQYFIFKLGSKEHIENIGKSYRGKKHLTKVSERQFKRFLKKFKISKY